MSQRECDQDDMLRISSSILKMNFIFSGEVFVTVRSNGVNHKGHEARLGRRKIVGAWNTIRDSS